MNDPQPHAPPLDYPEALRAVADLHRHPVKIRIGPADGRDRAFAVLRGVLGPPRLVETTRGTDAEAYRVVLEASGSAFIISRAVFSHAEERKNGVSIVQETIAITVERDSRVE